MSDETFGHWLKRRRQALDLTQATLATCAACSVVTIRKFEADERRPSRQLAEALADCLAIPAAERERFVAFARQPEAAAVAAGAPPPPAPAPPLPGAALSPPAAPHPAAAPAAPVWSPPPLPVPLTGLVGRQEDIAAVAERLYEPGVRAVTLTGPGGTGKTRLAIAIGQQLVAAPPPVFADGVAFIDLAPVHDPALVAAAIAQGLGLPDVAGRAPLEALLAHLATRRLLLILDNFEQVVEAAGDLARLLGGAGGLKLLLTSRAVLRLYGEHEYPVAPLPLPAAGATAVADLLAAPAVALFVERARAARPGFALADDNAAAVAAICGRLDGLPLAIELAAARVRLLSPAALLAHLTNALDLTGTARHVGERQRTLRGAIDWSYRLLDAAEQRLFDRLGVFNGAFSLPAAAAIGQDTAGEPDREPPLDFIDRLASLVDKSMVRLAGEVDGQPRFRLLVVLRDYANERLEVRGEAEATATRHLAYYLAAAERAAPFLEGRQAMEWLPPLSADREEFRAALAFGLARPALAQTALRLAVALGYYWRLVGQLSEGRRWLGQALAAAPGAPAALRATAQTTAGVLAHAQDDLPAAENALDAALAYWRAAGAPDRHQFATALRNLANIRYWQTANDEAARLWQEALALEEADGNLPAVASLTYNLGIVNKQMRRVDVARRYLERAITLQRQVGNSLSVINCLNGLSNLVFDEGRFDECRALLEEARALALAIDNRAALSFTLCNLADGYLATGELATAREHLEQALALAREGGFSRNDSYAEAGLAILDLLEGRGAAAWPALEHALATAERIHMDLMMDYPLYGVALLLARAGRGPAALALAAFVDGRHYSAQRSPHFQYLYERLAAALDLDEAARAAAEARGRALSLAEALALARAEGRAVAG